MRKRAVHTAVIVLLSLCAAGAAEARPQKGFHTGPYLALELGAMQEDFDTDQVTGLDVGSDFQPTFGFVFGWNIWDYFSGELQCRYSTNMSSSRREHIATVNAYGKWTFIADALTDFPTFRVLPFLKGGIASRIAALPGTPAAGKSTLTRFGVGPSAGAGIAFMWKRYFYFGVDLQEDFLFFDGISQTVNGVSREVYEGGFHPSFSASAILGVHY